MGSYTQKILIVDDLSSARKVLKRQLLSIGFSNLEEAKDGQEAMDLLAASSFDLVISDWEMPRLKGIELLQKIRSEERLKDIPFVMITSNNKKESVIEAAGLKVSAYLAKPFDENTLGKIVFEALEVSH